jgi:hypothetical protein
MTSAESADRRARHAYASGSIDIADLLARLALIAAGDPESIGHAAEGMPAVAAREPTRRGPKWHPADLGVLAELAAISDPFKRLVRAGQIATAEYKTQQDIRQEQITAVVAAHVRHGATQAACYGAIGMMRRKFHESVRQAPATLPGYGSAGAALQAATQQQAGYEDHRAKATTARLVRDREIRALTSGKYGPPVRAIRIAEVLGSTKANVSSIISRPIAA